MLIISESRVPHPRDITEDAVVCFHQATKRRKWTCLHTIHPPPLPQIHKMIDPTVTLIYVSTRRYWSTTFIMWISNWISTVLKYGLLSECTCIAFIFTLKLGPLKITKGPLKMRWQESSGPQDIFTMGNTALSCPDDVKLASSSEHRLC